MTLEAEEKGPLWRKGSKFANTAAYSNVDSRKGTKNSWIPLGDFQAESVNHLLLAACNEMREDRDEPKKELLSFWAGFRETENPEQSFQVANESWCI